MRIHPWTALAIPVALNMTLMGAGCLIVFTFSGSINRFELLLPVVVLVSFAVAPIVEGLFVQHQDPNRRKDESKRKL